MRILPAAAVFFLAFSLLTPASADSVTKQEVAKILADRQLNVRDYDSSKLLVEVANFNVIVWVGGPDGDISFITYVPGISGSDVSFQFLNEFNNKVKFGRVYVDSDGDVAIQMDRNASGGVSEENIESDFEVFLALIDEFLRDLESQAIA